jgi:hypothetical protein
MIDPRPVTLQRNGVRLEPLQAVHAKALRAAADDGELWKLWYVCSLWSCTWPRVAVRDRRVGGTESWPHAPLGRA